MCKNKINYLKRKSKYEKNFIVNSVYVCNFRNSLRNREYVV